MLKKLMILPIVMLLISGNSVNSQEVPQPGKNHKVLTQSAGTWQAKAKMWLPGMEEPVESEGLETVTSECDGFWIRTTFKGEFGGMPFRGIGMTTYDSVKKKYMGTWGDNLSPGGASMVGTYDAKSKTMTYMVTGYDAQQGKVVTNKHTEKHIDKDHRVMKIYQNGKVMLEINYTRTKGSALKNKMMNKMRELKEGAKSIKLEDLEKGVKSKMKSLKGKLNIDSLRKKINQ